MIVSVFHAVLKKIDSIFLMFSANCVRFLYFISQSFSPYTQDYYNSSRFYLECPLNKLWDKL
ncbi:hypothetical protein DPV73_07060 [Leptospira mayottensis]|nr:hypothetical protein DPV73_07060 [Leptospira mayottensis]